MNASVGLDRFQENLSTHIVQSYYCARPRACACAVSEYSILKSSDLCLFHILQDADIKCTVILLSFSAACPFIILFTQWKYCTYFVTNLLPINIRVMCLHKQQIAYRPFRCAMTVYAEWHLSE